MVSGTHILDRVFRWLLGVPGWILERLDGGAVKPAPPLTRSLYEAVRDTARHPDAHLALEPGLHHVVHDGHVLAYQRRGRTAFAVGGLNVEGTRRQRLLAAFSEAARVGGIVRQLLFPIRSAERQDVHEQGFETIQVGVEAWLDLADMTLEGRRFAHVRQMRNRARQRGIRVLEVEAERTREPLENMYDAWLAAKRPSWRMKLLVGSPGLDEPYDRRYFIAQGPARVEAFVTLLPGAQGTWGLDIMCRWPDATPGAMECLLVGVIERLRDEGAHALSLGACPMADVPLDGARPWLRRLFALLFGSSLGNRVFGFRGLYTFKAKFRPRWEPVYFGARPSLSWVNLYRGCRMWGLY